MHDEILERLDRIEALVNDLPAWPNADIQCQTVTVDEAAAILGVGRSTIHDAIKAGTFPVPFARIGRRIVINRRKLHDLIEELPTRRSDA